MTNPIKRLKQLIAAEKIMRDTGFPGESIVEMCQQAIDLIGKQHETIEKANLAMGDEESSGEVTVKYLIPYRVQHSQYHNGGRTESAHGMTMVDVDGGITNWQQVLGVAHFIKSQKPVSDMPNASVIINGLFPVDQWVEKEVEVKAGTN